MRLLSSSLMVSASGPGWNSGESSEGFIYFSQRVIVTPKTGNLQQYASVLTKVIEDLSDQLRVYNVFFIGVIAFFWTNMPYQLSGLLTGLDCLFELLASVKKYLNGFLIKCKSFESGLDLLVIALKQLVLNKHNRRCCSILNLFKIICVKTPVCVF